MRTRYARWLFFVVLLLTLPVRASDAPGVHVERSGDAMLVRADIPVAVDPATAWQVLTDYGRLADFVPDMKSSRILSRNGTGVIVQQQGAIGLLFIRAQVDVTLQVDEFPPRRMAFRAIGGNVKDMHGEWRIQPDGTTLRLSYRARIEPDFWVPPLIGSALLQWHVERQIEGVVQEMRRRYSARTTSSGSIELDTAGANLPR